MPYQRETIHEALPPQLLILPLLTTGINMVPIAPSGLISVSDNWMIILPVDPLAMPSKERAEAAAELLSTLRPGAQGVELRISDDPDFVGCGGNFVSVFCPFCRTDIVDWWTNEMQAWSHGSDRRRLDIQTPCCGRTSSLNDLDYVASQGFTRLAIEVMNPGGDLEPEEFRQVEEVLGLPLRIVWRHI